MLSKGASRAELSSVKKSKNGTTPLQGHSFVSADSSTFFILGGRTHSTTKGLRNILSETIKCSLKDGSIRSIEKFTSLDVPRHNHTSLFFECINSIVTFGGSNTTSYLNSIFVMNVNNQKDSKVINVSKTMAWPKVRHGHTANIYKKDQMIVFGGKKDFGTAANSYLNDLWSFNVTTNEWEEIKSLNSAPRERCWHSSVIYKDRFLLVSGGFFTVDRSEFYLNDLWSFDMETKLWTCLIENNDSKSCIVKQRNRSGMVLSQTQDALIIMFGNYFDGKRNSFWNDAFYVKNLDDILYSNNLEKCYWTKLEIQASDDASNTFLKEGRAHMTAVLLSNEETTQVLLFGGESKKQRHDTFFKLEIPQL
ncbi:predicted protein [Naegleria gruberi]|uniref:Predicted protein n=1 Tax=Naegleria gruberi TaxID=5762 RepID=D2VA53_NAEGR|nr:uncharacterized protein NAEGRDRAFT_65742 [Naegleria gruberi]EFC46368.1 predicted protein [Naegleria gruberi]|eukprot:XP_002679112.1 predicted protein [Naegleria gruberi strain NEG-M]